MRRFACLFFFVALAVSPLLHGQDAQGRGTGEQSHPQEEKEPDLSVWQWANFAILAAAIGYFGVKLGRPYFQGQTQSINQGLDEARARRDEAESRSREVHDKLAQLGTAIESFRDSVLNEQRAEAERMQERLRLEIERVHTNAANQIQHAVKQERAALQRHAAELALRLADRRLRFIMNGEKQEALASQFVEGLRA